MALEKIWGHWKKNSFRFTVLLWVLLTLSVTLGVKGLLESELENEILQTIADRIEARTKGQSEEAKIDSAIQLCYFLQERRTLVLSPHTFKSFKATAFRSSLQSFYIGVGACGYYSLFAARVLQKMGYHPKIVQQRVNHRWGAHITLAIPLKTSSAMIVVDPLYRHVFRNAQGELCSLQDLRKHWTYHSQTLPANYNPAYNYQQGWRHTNWDKYGFISRAAYQIFCWTMGQEKADLISARMWIIDPYRVQSVVSFLFGGYIIGLLILGGVLRWKDRGRVEENSHGNMHHNEG